MAWVKVPPENRPLFLAALPEDARVETLAMFGGLAAKVNGNFFAGLFGRSTMVWLPEPDRAEALALEGASYFDPMGDGRARSDKVMLPERMMREPAALRAWLARSFAAAAALPKKVGKKVGKTDGKKVGKKVGKTDSKRAAKKTPPRATKPSKTAAKRSPKAR